MKSALLTGILVGLLFLLVPVLTPKWVEGHANNGRTYMTTTTRGFLSLEKGSVDAVFLGSSQVLRGIATGELASEYGISAYSRATTVQAPSVSYYYLEDALKRQSPRVVLADFSALYTQYDPDLREPYVRYAFDWMPLDLDKLQAADEIVRTSKSQNLLGYALPSLYYHNRWTELSTFDVTYLFSGDFSDPHRGSILMEEAEPQDFVPLEGTGAEAEACVEDSLYWYQKMMDLCAEKGVPFIMLRMPRSDWTEEKHAADAALAERNGVPLVDFNLREIWEETGLDGETDFYDYDHLNSGGAAKLTAWLGNYLQQRALK